LDFKLPLDSILDAEAVVTFEETLEEFLREELIISSNGTKYVDVNATVVSQKLVPSNETLSNTGSEPFRRLLQEEMSLFISVLITASFASTDNSGAEINFQREITRAVTRNSERFFDELFATEAFEGLDPPDKSDDSQGDNYTAAIVSTVAGGVVIGSIALLFFIRRRHRRESSVLPPFRALAPPLDYSNYDDDDDDISSLGDEMFTAADKGGDGTDQLSSDDAFLFQHTEGQLEVPRSQLTDIDEDTLEDVDESSPGPNIFRPKIPVHDGDIVNESDERPSAPKSIKSLLFACFADNPLDDEQGERNVKMSRKLERSGGR
jgi:hypothetical protein